MKTNPIYDDRQLLESVRNGDEKAFTILFNRYAGRLYQVTLKYTINSSVAEEVVQEVFTKIWLNRNQLVPDLPFAPYLITISRNLIFNKAKRKLLEIAYIKYKTRVHNPQNNFTLNEVYLHELELLLKKSVDEMPPKRKVIFKLSRERGYRNKEIAKVLNISERTVENQINAALKGLKQYFVKG